MVVLNASLPHWTLSLRITESGGDGVKYLVLGGGGAEQDPILPGGTHVKVPEGYPPDQYWKGAAPKEDYNYLHVEVPPGQPTKFTLNRFRPWSSEPFATVELYK